MRFAAAFVIVLCLAAVTAVAAGAQVPPPTRLADRGPISVRSDAHISTGVSKPFMFDWIAHARGGAGTVYWLLLPTPRGQSFKAVFGPVNRALRAAARSSPGVVHVVDGVHLNVAGASIATTLIIRRMRRDGLIP